MMAWQQLLSGPTATLKDALALRYQESAASYVDSYACLVTQRAQMIMSFSLSVVVDVFRTTRSLEARLCLETGLYNHFFGESEQAKVRSNSCSSFAIYGCER
jgi:hypothetical protein